MSSFVPYRNFRNSSSFVSPRFLRILAVTGLMPNVSAILLKSAFFAATNHFAIFRVLLPVKIGERSDGPLLPFPPERPSFSYYLIRPPACRQAFAFFAGFAVLCSLFFPPIFLSTSQSAPVMHTEE